MSSITSQKNNLLLPFLSKQITHLNICNIVQKRTKTNLKPHNFDQCCTWDQTECTNSLHTVNGAFVGVCRSVFASSVILSPFVLNWAEQCRTRAASSLSCQSCDWDQPYCNDWENRPLQQKYHPKGLERPHSYNRVHTFVFINPILLCFVSFATKQLHSCTVIGEIKGPDIARGHRHDTVNRSALCCSWSS